MNMNALQAGRALYGPDTLTFDLLAIGDHFRFACAANDVRVNIKTSPDWYIDANGKKWKTGRGSACKRVTLTWHTVVNEQGDVLAVYGEALLSAAQETARQIEHQTGLPVRVEQRTGERPRVA